MKYEVIAPEENKSEIIEQSDLKTYKSKGYGVIRCIPESVEDEDWLGGHCYPGHECWND